MKIEKERMERKEKERKRKRKRKEKAVKIEKEGRRGQDRAGEDRTRAKHDDTHCHLRTQEEKQKFKVTLNYIKTLSQNKGREGGRKEGRQGKEQSAQKLKLMAQITRLCPP